MRARLRSSRCQVRGAAAVVLLIGACAATLTFAESARADVPITERAARRFEEGVRYLRSHDPDRYEKAYREFKAAYAESPSWKILGNLGIVAQELERDGEAIEAYEGYLKGGGKELSKAERKQFERDLALLESGLTTVTIRSVPDGAWIVDERLPEAGTPIVNRYGPTSGPLELRVRAGHHRMRAELAGYEDDTWEFSEPAGASTAHTFELQRPEAPVAAPTAPPVEDTPPPAVEKPSSSLPTWGFVALGAGAVGVGIGTWFLVDASKKSETATALHDRCVMESMPPTSCTDDSDDYQAAMDADAAEARALTGSLIGFSVGGAFLATGAVLLLLGSDTDATEQASITPWIGPSSVGLTGSF